MDEYISREETLKAFRLTAKNSNKDYQRGLQDPIDCLVPEVIADIPAADVQPVRHERWKCSSCGQLIYSTRESDRKIMHAYCSRCGARMDGGING